MKVCQRLLDFTQVYDTDGSVRICSWLTPNFMRAGRLCENSMEEIWHGEKVKKIFERQSAGDFSVCDHRNCAYLSAGKKPPLIEVNEIPDHPTRLAIGYEKLCNYRCSVCSEIHEPTFNCSNDDIIAKREKIEENLKAVLPHVKWLSANGCGELFLSKHIMKLLADWKPLAPKEEISVSLETNGSLFDEEHWREIENLGQYDLTVVITVMSFDEHTYQVLSGVKYPISRIENNLRFVKSLREKNIINHFAITTVVQERNFRTLPQWFKRCDEEFGADTIRMRPYVPYNDVSPEMRWITDIRGTEHPYRQEYLDILKDPIFKNPKLLDWGVFTPQEHPMPYKQEKVLRENESKILCQMLSDDSGLKKLEDLIKDSGDKVIIHGAGGLGRMITKSLTERGNVKVEFITDFKQHGEFLNIPIVNLNDGDSCDRKDYDKTLPIVVTWLETQERHFSYFRSLGYTGRFIKLDEIFDYNCGCDCK